MDYKALHDEKARLERERASLQKEARGNLSAAIREKRELTDEERKRDDEIEAKVSEIDARLEVVNADIARYERAFKEEAEAKPGARHQGDGSAELHGQVVTRERVLDDPNWGFENLADFALATRSFYHPDEATDPRILKIGAAPTNFHQEQGTGEGRMVPPAMREEIWDLVFAGDDFVNAVDWEPTSSNSVELNRDETTPWGSTGVQANWRAEGSQMSATKLVTEGEQVRLHELYAFVLATEELLQDAPRLNARLQRRSAEAINWKASEAILNGNGAGQPLGIMKSGAIVSQAKESGQAADTIVAGNVSKMYGRMLPGGEQRAAWYIAPDAFQQLMQMTVANQPIWFPDFRTAPGGVLLGLPVRRNMHMETVGDKGDILLFDPRGYYATRRTSTPDFATSMHLYFDYNMQAFRWTFRLGGQPFLSAPVSPAKGNTTLSHFITLDARA